MKLGRNGPCWCGSGMKYKKCHLGRNNEKPVQSWEVDASIRSWNKSGECLHVGATAGSICGAPAIGSHTVPRKMLRQIARNGHVYGPSATMRDLNRTQGRLTTKLIGVNDASVLRVFCQTHDGNTFAPLEQMPFVATQEQCFLLAYRAICHEFFKKSHALKSLPTLKSLDKGKSLLEQVALQTNFERMAYGWRLSMRDLEQHKQQFDAMAVARDYAEIRAFIVAFDDVPDILCSGAVYPQWDFAGELLQDLSDHAKKMELMTFSLIATDNAGAFVFAWHKDGDNICRLLATSLERLPDEELPHAVVRFVFEFCENHYLGPDWWDAVSQPDKARILGRLQTVVSPVKRSAGCLIDDGLRAVSWKVTGKTWL
jgi:hypothetical protein